MNRAEQRATLALALIMACRMLGLFMILPFFSLYTNQLASGTPFLIGVALGAYGLTQACFQLPMGALSDRIGRKPTIYLGLVVFALGSLVAAMSHSIYGIILGRALQGAGAIGSTVMALATDLTRETCRSQALAILGITIALSFVAAMLLGPWLNTWIHLNGIFWLICALAGLGILLLNQLVPNPPSISSVTPEQTAARNWQVLKQANLQRLYFGVFCLHSILTLLFIGLPILLKEQCHLTTQAQTMLYIKVLPLAFILMAPLLRWAEKNKKLPQCFPALVLLLCLALGILDTQTVSLTCIAACLCAFFIAFTWLEAAMPALVAKYAPAAQKGTAMGLYSTAQFSGIFIGGLLGGAALGQGGFQQVFLIATIMGLVWFVQNLRGHQLRKGLDESNLRQ
jgi:predicted MFS family arabinose efflux permease